MNEDEFFAFDDNVRTKRFRLFRRDVVFRHLEGRMAESGILRHTERISPLRPDDGTTEDIFLEHVYRTDCQCIAKAPGAACVVCGRIFCAECVQRLQTFCAVCGGFACGEDFFPGFGDSKKGYCRNHRFHWRRLITG